MIFTADFIARLYTAPLSSAFCNSRVYYLTSFFGIVDVLSIAPYYIEQLLAISTPGSAVIPTNATVLLGTLVSDKHEDPGGSTVQIFRVFRIFRLLQLERFVTAFSMLDDVYRGARGT